MSGDKKEPSNSISSFFRSVLQNASEHDAYHDITESKYGAENDISQTQKRVKGVVAKTAQTCKTPTSQEISGNVEEPSNYEKWSKLHAHSNHDEITVDSLVGSNPGQLYFGDQQLDSKSKRSISKEAVQDTTPKMLQIPTNAFFRQVLQNVTMKTINEGVPGLVATAKSQPKYFTAGWMSRVPYNLFGINTALHVFNKMQEMEGSNNIFSNSIFRPAIAAATEYGAGFIFEFSSLYSGIYSEKVKSLIKRGGTKSNLGRLSEIGFGNIFTESSRQESNRLFAKHQQHLMQQGLNPKPNQDTHSFMNSRRVATEIAERENFRFCDFTSKEARKTLEGTLNVRIGARDLSRAFVAGSIPGAFRNLPFYIALSAGDNSSDSKKIAIAVAGGVVTTIPNNISSIAMQEAAKGKPVLEALTKASKISIDQFRTSKAAASIGVGARILANLAAIEIYGQSSTAKIQELTGLVYDLFARDVKDRNKVDIPSKEIAPELKEIDESCRVVNEAINGPDNSQTKPPKSDVKSATAKNSLKEEKSQER